VEHQNKYIMRITASESEGKKEITNFISKKPYPNGGHDLTASVNRR
jgi:type I site-specific restriction endonuclease